MWHALTTVLFGMVLWAAQIDMATSVEAERHDLVTGILEELDMQNAKGKIRTDLGRPIFFEIVKPELLKGVRVGERVTIELDAEGRAMKITEVAAPELPPPS